VANAQGLAKRYVSLGLRLGEHVDGLVDSYFGPSELRDGGTSEPPALLEEARSLLAELASGEGERQRRRWLSAQVVGLECVAELLAGEQVPWSEAVKRCYGVEVEPVPEERFEEVRARLDAAVPGRGGLAERLEAWNVSQQVPPEALLPAFEALVEELRRETRELVELPTGEQIEVELVTDRPWSAYNAYLGDLKSRIEINTIFRFAPTSSPCSPRTRCIRVITRSRSARRPGSSGSSAASKRPSR
jgi:hypothetical protein